MSQRFSASVTFFDESTGQSLFPEAQVNNLRNNSVLSSIIQGLQGLQELSSQSTSYGYNSVRQHFRQAYAAVAAAAAGGMPPDDDKDDDDWRSASPPEAG